MLRFHRHFSQNNIQKLHNRKIFDHSMYYLSHQQTNNTASPHRRAAKKSPRHLSNSPDKAARQSLPQLLQNSLIAPSNLAHARPASTTTWTWWSSWWSRAPTSTGATTRAGRRYTPLPPAASSPSPSQYIYYTHTCVHILSVKFGYCLCLSRSLMF